MTPVLDELFKIIKNTYNEATEQWDETSKEELLRNLKEMDRNFVKQ